jgi:hypothetical protein
MVLYARGFNGGGGGELIGTTSQLSFSVSCHFGPRKKVVFK